jgi:hypothetical protein
LVVRPIACSVSTVQRRLSTMGVTAGHEECSGLCWRKLAEFRLPATALAAREPRHAPRGSTSHNEVVAQW